jgi:ABC-type lipoprotein export system ATPase subunit
MSKIFDVKNLNCKYKGGEFPVLKIPELIIEKGDVVFFVGASGVGKSTILETLGIMNDTVEKIDGTIFNFFQDEKAMDLSRFWGKSEQELASFRRENLSFIFQNTNLFNNLTAFENVCISQIIQGKNRGKAELDAKRMLKKMFEPDVFEEIILGKKITEMSGGQRQRLAFVRATVTDYQVLLADEPTGNLDWANANNLIERLVDDVREANRTAIIVTHDINLALNYGDRIVLIKKMIDEDVKDRIYGQIDAESVFRSIDLNWTDSNNQKIKKSDLGDYLKKQLK